jgi:hypothetical protein
LDLFGKGGGERMAKELGAQFLGRLPLLPEVVRTGDAGRPAVTGDSQAREAFTELALKVWDFVQGNG